MNSVILVLLIAVGAAIGVLTLTALIFRFILLHRYITNNDVQINSGITARNICREVLDANGLQEVKVEKVGFFRMLFFGNHYSVMKKTIFLRKNILDKNTLTALGVSLQKVGLALQHSKKEKGFMLKYALQIISFFNPFIFYLIVIAGFVIDYFVGFTGVIGTSFTIAGLVYYIVVFVCLLITTKSEKKANAQALYVLKNTNLLNEEEIEKVNTLLNTYVTISRIDYVIALLKIIYMILKLFLKSSNKSSN